MLNWIEKKMLTRINKKMGVKLTNANLILSFNDMNGNGYYKFPKDLELPLNRMAKVQEYLMWLAKGVSKEEYIKTLEIAEKGLEGGIKDGKGLAKIGFILQELKDRCNMVIHSELFYNVIAVQIIRHDENPNEFNNDIHLQKVEAFKELDKMNDSFFLNIQEYLEPLGLSSITKKQLDELLIKSQVARKSLERILSTL